VKLIVTFCFNITDNFASVHAFYIKMDIISIEIREKIDRTSILSQNGACRLWTGALTRDRRYGVSSYKDPVTGRYRKKHIHRLAYMVHVGDLYLNPRLDCSHLCHNTRCVNVAHISCEPHSVNNNRQRCCNLGACQGHGHHAACMLHLRLTR